MGLLIILVVLILSVFYGALIFSKRRKTNSRSVEMLESLQLAQNGDRAMRFCTYYDKEVNGQILQDSLKILVNRIPILSSSFHSNFFHAEWVENEKVNMENIYQFYVLKKNEVLSAVAEDFLLKVLEERKGELLKVLHIRSYNEKESSEESDGSGKDAVAILMNHMGMDGPDLMRFCKELSDIYGMLKNGANIDLSTEKEQGRRDYNQLFQSVPKAYRSRVNRLFSFAPTKQYYATLPFEKSRQGIGIYPKINRIELPQVAFHKLKANCKRLGVTINDAMVGAYYRLVYLDVLHYSLAARRNLSMPVMMDLRRRYMSEEEINASGHTNLISLVTLDLKGDVGATLLETILSCKQAMDHLKLKENFPGLAGLALVDLVFKYLPWRFAMFLVYVFYKAPWVGFTNLGIVDPKIVTLGDARPVDVFTTGPLKYPPNTLLCINSYCGRLYFQLGNYGTQGDHAMLQGVLERLVQTLTAFGETELDAGAVDRLWAKYPVAPAPTPSPTLSPTPSPSPTLSPTLESSSSPSPTLSPTLGFSSSCTSASSSSSSSSPVVVEVRM